MVFQVAQAEVRAMDLATYPVSNAFIASGEMTSKTTPHLVQNYVPVRTYLRWQI